MTILGIDFLGAFSSTTARWQLLIIAWWGRVVAVYGRRLPVPQGAVGPVLLIG